MAGSQADLPPEADEPSEEQRQEVRAALGAPTSAPVVDLPFYEQDKRDREQEIDLKRFYAKWLLVGLGAQIAVIDAAMMLYAWRGVHWKIDTNLVSVWLSATVVETVSIVYVVTRHLFPERKPR